MLAAGTQLGRYEISAPLGAGAMGEVYRANDSRLDRQVAIKVLPPQFVQDQARLARFEREAKAVAALSHPNILGIHDFGTEQGQTFAVMELLEGQTLRERIFHGGALPWRKVVEIAVAIADGLAAAHAKGIIHRDLKPENIFLTTDDRIKVLDFGLARIEPAASSGETPTDLYLAAQTEAGAILGTVGYMSPEQVRAQVVDGRSDVFSLGCVLHEMITGRRTFARQSAVETMAAVLQDDPPALTESVKEVPLELDRLIRHCLEKKPEQRFQSARDLAFALRSILSDSGVSGLRTTGPGATRRPVALWVLAASAGIGMVAVSAFLIVPALRNTAATNQAGKPGRAFESLAILPLANVTDDPKGESLCEGLAEHLSGSLSRVGNLKVRPITSTVHYRGQRVDAKTIGRELDVRAVVTGRLRQEGETLIIALELVDAHDNSLVWSNQYKGNRQQILDLQDQLARDLAGKLGLRLTAEEEQLVTKRHTQVPEAYLLYREGVYHMHKFTEDGLATAIEYYQRAIKKDANYAAAYAGLGHSHNLLGAIHRGPREYHPQAKIYLNKALAIDPGVPGAHGGLGAIHMFHDWDWPAAEREFKLASGFDPGLPSKSMYGFYLAAMGRPADALAAIREGTALDPLSTPRRNEVAMGYNWVRQYDQAIAEAQKAIELDPNFPLAHAELAISLVQKGLPEQAIAKLQKAIDAGQRHPRVIGMLGYAHAVAGQREPAQNVLNQLQGLAPGRFGFALPIARIHAALGEKDQAFEWLQKAAYERDPHVVWIKVDATLDDLRSDPRFDAILQDMRLADKAASQDQGIQSVAVLPLENVGGDPKTEFLSDGLADQIINSLSQVRRQNLKVRPFSSVSRYKLQKPALQTIARELNVQAIVTGSLHQQGEDLSIGVELVDAREDNRLWGKHYRGKLNEILDLQDQIARDVAANLRLQLTGAEEKQLTKRHTEDPGAYLLYREGVFHLNKFTPEGLQTGIEYFQRALKMDQNYAPALVGVGRCKVLLGTLHLGPKATHPEARELLTKALMIDSTLSDAHAGLGAIHLFHDWDWPAAERVLKQAIATDASTPLTWNIYGFYLAAQGRLPEALESIKRGQQIDPLAAPRRHEVAMCYVWMRRYDEAIAEAKKALELDPNFPNAHAELSKALAEKGMPDEAIAELRKAPNFMHGTPLFLGQLGYAYAMAGKRVEAEKVVDVLKDPARFRYGCAFAIATIQAALGERDQALEWLNKACEERHSRVIWLKVDPTWDNLRSDPRFDKILQDMGLADKAAAQKQPPIDSANAVLNSSRRLLSD